MSAQRKKTVLFSWFCLWVALPVPPGRIKYCLEQARKAATEDLGRRDHGGSPEELRPGGVRFEDPIDMETISLKAGGHRASLPTHIC